MEARVHKLWNKDETEIYLSDRPMNGGCTYFKATADGVVGTTVSAGAPIEPFLTLPNEAAEALAIALSELPVPSRAVVEHLKDAKDVRDRLLAIVETQIHGGQP